MKNNLNPVAIGMFVLGAAIIAVVTVMIFGAAKFFARTEKFVSYFSESVNGLDVGAPLKYKGVQIGKVEAIRIISDKNIKESSVAVIYSIDIDMLKRKAGDIFEDYDKWIDAQIADGMRAKLNYQSIVTGMLYVELDFFAEKGDSFQLRYGGIRFKEIPSAKSGLAELAKSLERTIEDMSKIKFSEIGENTNRALISINKKLDALDMKALNDSSLKTLADIDNLVTDPKLRNAVANLDALLAESRVVLADLKTDFHALGESAKVTFSNFDSVLKNVDTMVAPQSPLRFELAILLRSLNESVNSLSNFTDYLQRNPSSLLTGKARTTPQNNE